MVPTDHDDHSGPADRADAVVPTESVRLSSLSLPARLVVALSIGGLAVFAAWHALAAFLFVAPSNTIMKDHGPAIRGYIYPEFEQNWKLFAPNPSSAMSPSKYAPRSPTRRTAAPRPPNGWISPPST